MEKNRAPPPSHQKNENQNVSKPAEQLDLSIQNEERFEGLKNETTKKSEENMAPQHQEIQMQKTAEQLEGIIDAPNQDEFGLPCITDVPNNALATLIDVASQESKLEAKSLYITIFMTHKLRFWLILGRLTILKKKLG